MKTIAYVCLHYGKGYLGAAIQSMIDHVDEMWLLYSTKPSHGHSTDAKNPDTRDELYEIAKSAAGAKFRWHDGEYQHEGLHRDKIKELVPDAGMIYVLDSDEIWTDKVHAMVDSERGYPGAYITIPFIHFYRTLHHAVLHDPAAPPRVLFPQATRRDLHLGANLDTPIIHLGYAQPAETIRYKLKIHGHRNELRCSPDEYVDKIYLDRSRWNDVHPVGSEFWNPVPVNPADYFPSWMKYHKFWDKEVIE